MKKDLPICMVSVERDDEIIAVIDLRMVDMFLLGYDKAGGDTDDLSINQISQITIS